MADHTRENDLIGWKSIHEAAHAVIAVSRGFTVLYVDLDYDAEVQGVAWDHAEERSSDSYSRLDYMAVCAAGAAADQNVSLPPELSYGKEEASAGDRTMCKELLERHLGILLTDDGFSVMWTEGVVEAEKMMGTEIIWNTIRAVSKDFSRHFRSGNSRVDGKIVISTVTRLLHSHTAALNSEPQPS